MADEIRIDDDITLKIPMGRVFDHRTGKNWEGVGITPDVPVAVERALDVAHELARAEIKRSAGKSNKRRS